MVVHHGLARRPVRKSQFAGVLCKQKGRSHRLLDRLDGAGAAVAARVAIAAVRRQQRRFSYGPQPAGRRPEPLSSTDLYESRLSVHYIVLFIIYVLTGTVQL